MCVHVKSPDMFNVSGRLEFLLRLTSVPLRPTNSFFTKKLLNVFIVSLTNKERIDVKPLRYERIQCGHVALILLWLYSL
jgi:hypothetical protein